MRVLSIHLACMHIHLIKCALYGSYFLHAVSYCLDLCNLFQVFRNWAENAMITAVDEARTFAMASPEVKSKLAGLCIKWLSQTCVTLEGDPNPTATLTKMWSMMRLVCRCATDTDDCLKVVADDTGAHW